MIAPPRAESHHGASRSSSLPEVLSGTPPMADPSHIDLTKQHYTIDLDAWIDDMLGQQVGKLVDIPNRRQEDRIAYKNFVDLSLRLLHMWTFTHLVSSSVFAILRSSRTVDNRWLRQTALSALSTKAWLQVISACARHIDTTPCRVLSAQLLLRCTYFASVATEAQLKTYTPSTTERDTKLPVIYNEKKYQLRADRYKELDRVFSNKDSMLSRVDLSLGSTELSEVMNFMSVHRLYGDQSEPTQTSSIRQLVERLADYFDSLKEPNASPTEEHRSVHENNPLICTAVQTGHVLSLIFALFGERLETSQTKLFSFADLHCVEVLNNCRD
jgi:hypothetical protein